MTLEDYKKAANRVVGLVAAAESGRKSNISRDQHKAMVEMMLADVRDRELKAACFLQHPAHLPEGKDLQKLMESPADRDKQLRADAISWRDINRGEADKAAVSLRNAVHAVRMCDELLQDADEAEQEEVVAWRREISEYLLEHFGASVRQAPRDESELRMWCGEHAAKANPCPLWLRVWRPGGAVFAAKPRSMAEEFAKTMTNYGKEEDE